MLLISLLLIPVGLVLAVLVTLVGLLIYRHIHARIFCRKYPFPGPNPELFAVDLTEEHLSQESHFQRFGSHFRQFLLGIPIYTVANAEDARHILTVKNLRKSYIVEERLSGVWGRYGLITASHAGDNPWRIYRRLADPSFKVSALKGMQGIFNRHAQDFVEYLGSMGERAFDIQPELKRLTFNIISDVIGCGPDVVDSNFLNAFITNIGFVNSPLLLFPLGWAVFKALHRKEYNTVINTAEEIIRSRKNMRKNSEHHAAISAEKSRIDILDLLLSAEDESGRKLSDLEIRDQMVQIFGAGYDTTANTLSWFFYMMAKRKDLQQRVVEEVDRLQDFSKESLESMTFTFMVLRETLRLYPTVLFLSRETDSDELVLPSGHIIPPHTHVEVSPLLLHRSSTYWDEPLEFRPERFAPGGEASLPKAKNAFIPFSSGPRSCIGKLFFQYESRTIICHIFKRFTLELVEHEENGALESSDGLMKPKKVWIRLKKRK